MHARIAVVVAVLSIVAGSSWANGINPPRPAQSGGGMQATCVDRVAGSAATIERAQLRYDDMPVNGLEVKQGDSAYKSVALSEFTRVTLVGGNPDRDGRVKGVITLTRPALDVDVLVRVRSEGATLKVAGFTPNGEPAAVEVSRCKEIVVRPPAPDPLRDAPKK